MSDQSAHTPQTGHPRADWVGLVVYGTLAWLTAVGALRLEADALRPRESAAVLIVVAAAAWLAHATWHGVQARTRHQPLPEGQHELHDELRELVRSWPIVASGIPAALVILLTTAVSSSVSRGLEIDQALGVATLSVAGLITARVAGLGHRRQLAYALALPCVGVAIVALEVAAHHT